MTAVSGRIPVFVGGLALAIALLLAPDAAQAQTNATCGALNSGNSFTENCPDAAYANGIVYWNQASAVTLTVPGTATTATITASTTAWNGLDNGITIRTSAHATEARNIALTVGGTGAVAIVQGSSPEANAWWRNHGILISPHAANGSTVTVDVKSGVTIGTTTTSMSNTGIEIVDVPGAVSVTSAARIYAGVRGIRVGNSAGTAMVTNSGAITAGGDGIYVRSSNSAGAVTVTNSGAITSGNDGIFARTDGQDAAGANAGVSVTHSAGAIASTGRAGIVAHVGVKRGDEAKGMNKLDETGAVVGGPYVAPMNVGLAKVAVTGGSIASKGKAVEAINYEAGSVEVDVSEGVTLTSTHYHGIHAEVADAGNASGTVAVTNAGKIVVTAGYGIVAIRRGGSGAVTVDNSGAIEAGGDGIFVIADGAGGAVSVTNSGAIGKADAAVARGIFVSHDGSGAVGGVTVASSAAITATDHGILAQAKGQDAENANVGVTVTHSAGAVVVASDEPVDDGSQGVKEGIVVRVGNWRQETDAGHAGYVAPRNRGLARAAVTGGSVRAKGVAVEVANYEAGSVEIDVSEGVTLTSTHDHGIEADLRDVGNASGTIAIDQAGTISAAKDGISAKVAWSGGAGPARAIDIEWTGTFTPREVDAVRTIPNVTRALQAVRQQAVEEAEIHYTRGNAGIDAGVMKWSIFRDVVARSDDPGAIADKAAQDALFADDADAATKARAAAIVAQLRSVLTNSAFTARTVTIRGADDVDGNDDGSYSDDEITAYLSEDSNARRTLLRNVLALSLTDEEVDVFEAVATGGDVDAALAAVPGASDAYKAAVKALLANHNVGDIRVAMNGGSIDSSGDGIRAWFARSHASNGGIEVIVAEGATVTGDAAGIYVSGAGTGLSVKKQYTSKEVQEAEANRELDADALVSFPDYLDQVVRVQGTVTGGTDAAVHLDGGGALIVTGAGKLVAGSSGRAVLVNDPGPAVIYVDGEVTGGAGPEDARAPAAVHLTGGGSVTIGLEGRVDAGGAMSAIRGDAPTAVIVHTESTVDTLTQEQARADLARIEGGSQKLFSGEGITEVTFAEIKGGVPTGFTRDGLLPVDPADAEVDEDEEIDVEFGELRFSCNAQDGRCRLYEALPSILLAMNGLPTRAERASAARDGSGGWARIEGGGGKWTAERSASPGAKLSFDHSRYGVHAGADAAVGENGRLGASVHGFRGEAKVPSSGMAKLSGVGVGVHATAMLGGFHVDAQAAMTWYDVDLKSSMHATPLKADVKGRGHAVGVEVGRRTPVSDEMSVTPRAGVMWSEVSLNDFTDEIGSGAEVSVNEGESLTGRAGVSVESEASEGVRLFGTVDVTHEFSEETEVAVSGTPLKASAETTGVRFGVGGTFDLGHGASLQGTAGYALTGGSGNRAYGGGLNLIVNF